VDQLKTILIIILVVSVLISAILPSGLRLIVQVPLFVIGTVCLADLFRWYTSRTVDSSGEVVLRILGMDC
jgi:hypothetical protein